MQKKLSAIPITILLLTPLLSQAVSYTYTSKYLNQTSTSSSSSDGRSSVSVQQNISASSNSEVTTSGKEQVSTSTQQSSEIHIEAHSGGTTQTDSNGSSGADGTYGKDVSAESSTTMAHLIQSGKHLTLASTTPVHGNDKPVTSTKPTSKYHPAFSANEVLPPQPATSTPDFMPIHTKEELQTHISTIINENPNIKKISTNAGNVSVQAVKPTKLFWIFPVKIPLTATFDKNGTVKTHFPWWYKLFFGTADQTFTRESGTSSENEIEAQAQHLDMLILYLKVN